jgi:hypothetical protein
MRLSWTKRGQILARVKSTLIFTGAVMAAAVAVLAGVTVFAEQVWVSVVVLVVGVGAFVASLIVIGGLVWSVSRDA